MSRCTRQKSVYEILFRGQIIKRIPDRKRPGMNECPGNLQDSFNYRDKSAFILNYACIQENFLSMPSDDVARFPY